MPIKTEYPAIDVDGTIFVRVTNIIAMKPVITRILFLFAFPVICNLPVSLWSIPGAAR